MRAIITFANDRGNYKKGVHRLYESLIKFDNNHFSPFYGEESVGSPNHLDNPYAFKVYCWQKVIDRGYKKILWLDASVVAVNNLQPVWDKIDEQGYIMQYAGHLVGSWCNDRTLSYFDLTREQAMSIPMYGNAGFLGLDLDVPICQNFFNEWKKSMLDGQFQGSWQNHRHDMTCGSIIANRLGMNLESGDEWLHYLPPNQTPRDEKIIFHASGL